MQVKLNTSVEPFLIAFAVLNQISTHLKYYLNRRLRHDYFRSRDKHDGHTIRSAIAENPMLPANITALYSIEPELWPIKDFPISAMQILCTFSKKNLGNIKFNCLQCKAMQKALKHVV